MASYKFWKNTTILSLFLGYSGYYICRSNLSVITPLIIDNLHMDKEAIAQIASMGVFFYALGKVTNGILGDLVGGKKVFILGMAGSVIATIAFGLGAGIFAFLIAWAFNRYFQSMGWGGLVKISVNWFSYKSYGRVMSILSLSYLFGDILAKLILGTLMNWEYGWREIFFIAAGILFLIMLLQFLILKNTPEDLELSVPPENPNNLFKETAKGRGPECIDKNETQFTLCLEGQNSEETRASSVFSLAKDWWPLVLKKKKALEKHSSKIRELLHPYLTNYSFILLLIISFGLTAIREAFSFWIPTYLHESAGLAQGEASQASSLYSIFGLVSILGAGYFSDTLFKGKRSKIIIIACAGLAVTFYFMYLGLNSSLHALCFISFAGFFLLGPYSFLAGAMSLDIGGRKGAATAAGLLDAVGYLGASTALWLTGTLSQRYGWNSAFFALVIFAVLTGLTAVIYYFSSEKAVVIKDGKSAEELLHA